MSLELKITSDGSHTLYVPELNEHYHSIHGSIQESRHIFIDAGFNALTRNQKEIKILEIGFGTGLNALLTLQECSTKNSIVSYYGIEAHPLFPEIYSQLNYVSFLKQEGSENYFRMLHESAWEKQIKISENFYLTKIHRDLREYTPPVNEFDLIYFDAFGPDVQPELWSVEIFEKLYKSLKTGGILTTYSCKGNVKRALKSAGFLIEKLPGPPGKREIIRSLKNKQG
ncbi:MAG: SAM-dependent methyltransferase [Bacteroidetes bacterium RIFOXYA12_FULL_35_11]|nr:MAG: SAM-dependent methyltransferase [Bacteroidetes bacterium GWF2_35_48]OFY72408.1 MAG: SAM-dependent methyltransferase [Bacteroidetes bacterium RIFOXYA12_FULL_35_11]HBX53771.1 SAM-dependent methyltransferase [Bacteroidales bacterium]